jgi:hypothetical protein
VATENAAIRNTKLNHQFLFGIMCGECDIHNKFLPNNI